MCGKDENFLALVDVENLSDEYKTFQNYFRWSYFVFSNIEGYQMDQDERDVKVH